MTANRLYYGDNLMILRDQRYFPNDCVDLIYVDPPFNSNRNYNVLFKDESGKNAAAQITAFEDTWHWTQDAQETYYDLIQNAPASVSQTIGALYRVIGTNQMMAYVVMMTARMVEMHRVLKPTGSLYLHCDPTASHYLKIVLDTIFGYEHFRNEIIWQRTNAKGLAFTNFAKNHDVILRYSKGDKWAWNATYIGHDPEYVKQFYKYTDSENGRRYRLDNLANPNKNRPNLTYEFLGVTRVWRWTRERMQEAYEQGLVIQTKSGAVPQFKRYLDEQEGTPIGDVWTDISPLQGASKEALGYPTQKPLALLERIIAASSNEGDVVLDAFCGCGTAIAAAQKLNRRWIGIDITHLSISLQKYRMKAMFPELTYEVVGEPEDVGSARQLALDDKYQFQWWVLSKVAAKPLGGVAGSKQGKKGSDRGIDGIIDFIEDSGKPRQVLIQVKGGANVKSGDIRDLKGVLDRENGAIGVYLTLEPPTREMTTEAVSAGFYTTWKEKYPRLQILTVADLFDGKTIQMPRFRPEMFRKAERVNEPTAVQRGLLED